MSGLDCFGDAMREKIGSGELEQIALEPVHLHPAGLYVRELFMPAGAQLLSRVHLYEHLTVVLTGRCIVIDDDGNRLDVVAPDRWVTPAGTQRALKILEDSRWLTVHATDETDPDKLFDLLTCNSMADYKNRLTRAEL